MSMRSLRLTACAILVLCLLRPDDLVAGIYYVDQGNARASDANPGTEELPFKTATKGVTGRTAGDTVRIKAGDYREKVRIRGAGTADKPIVVQAYGPGQVNIKGSDVFANWVDRGDISGGKKYATAVSYVMVKPFFNGWKNWDPTGKYGGRVEMVFVDGKSLKQVLTEAEVRPATFYVPTRWEDDKPPSTSDLLIGLATGDNPSSHTIEVATRQSGVSLYGSNSQYIYLSGVHVMHVASIMGLGAHRDITDANKAYTAGLVVDGARNCRIENCSAEWNNWSGLAPDQSTYVAHCLVQYNGNAGVGGSPKNSIFQDCVVSNNSWRYGPYWASGGLKLASGAADNIFRRLTVRNNNGPGIWFDFGGTGNVIEDCLFDNNTNSGVDLEATPGPTIVRNCVIAHTQKGTSENNISPVGNGISIYNCPQVTLYHNTIVYNPSDGVKLSSWGLRDKTYLHDLVMVNNIIAFNGEYALLFWGGKPGSNAMNTHRLDYNLWYAEGEDPTLIRWHDGKKYVEYTARQFQQFQQATGDEQHGIFADPCFVNPSSDDFRVKPQSPAIGHGAIGLGVTIDFAGHPRPKDKAPQIGAYEVSVAPAPQK